MTLPEKQVLKTKICCFCNEVKPIKSFYINNALPSGIEPRCKMCKNSGNRCRKKTHSITKGLVGDTPKLYNVRKQDWIELYRFLEQIGYDIRSEKTIHEQFCDKYNLSTKKMGYEKSIKYSPKDLGLV